ncbi:urea amidolyase family protein [uncultured Bifidobacterium sp.]|uniref:5-oxoprolinase subunit B/C family protein n=1 Tax=uncultured Bifidobacterium sp. TaxID=165187 RepID=UPI00260A0690|nr:urea amidolyase family protein [uncultured Bifidobacterium sp.]
MIADARMMQVGESAVLIEVDGLPAVMDLAVRLRQWVNTSPLASDGVLGLVPAARTVMVRYDPALLSPRDIARVVDGRDSATSTNGVPAHVPGRDVTIPVVYDGEDVDAVARLWGVSEQAVVDWHMAGPWTAAFCGFAPGFAYLARVGGDAGNHGRDVPRLPTPRTRVPGGAVGLAGRFSGVYPRESSGGWRLIGRTDVVMWDESRDSPALVRAGDRVFFTPARESVRVPSHVDEPHAVDSHEAASDDGRSHAERTCATESSADRCDAGGSRRRGLIVEMTGMAALFEDDGRSAGDMGVADSGALDPVAFHTANELVGNDPGAAAIEITAGGARVKALGDVVVAVAGAPIPISIVSENGMAIPVLDQRPVLLLDGERMVLGHPARGWRDYLAIQGGFRVDSVLGSASRDTMSGIGPRPLARGDLAEAADGNHATVGKPLGWGVSSDGDASDDGNTSDGDAPETLDVILGPRDDWFLPDSVADFLSSVWTVTARSNRVGLRLADGPALRRTVGQEIASEATVPGAIEVPSDGMPVVFLRDQPVTGGYPVVAVLSTESLRRAGQLPVGARVSFRPVGTRSDADGRRNGDGCIDDSERGGLA